MDLGGADVKKSRPAQIEHHTFANGLTLLAERMDHVRSAALNFLVPAGCAYDPPGKTGMASVLAEMITRGAGERNSRELSLALDSLGLDRDESVGQMHMRIVEPGHHEMPAQVDHLGSWPLHLENCVVAAYGLNSSIAHRDGFCALDGVK